MTQSDRVRLVVSGQASDIVTGSGDVNNLYFVTRANLLIASQAAFAFNGIYKYFRITKCTLKLTAGPRPVYDTSSNAGMQGAIRKYGSRIQLEPEGDSPDTVEEVSNSTYGKLHREGSGFTRSWIPRPSLPVEGPTANVITAPTMVGKPGQWFRTAAADTDLPRFYGLQVVMDTSPYNFTYEVWQSAVIEFKTRLNK